MNHSPPFIIGHRGASTVAPENTLAAFRLALEAGAHGLELDVRLARDGVPVCIHDATLDRTALLHKRVAELTSQQLRHVDAGSWFNRRFPALAQEKYGSESIPTLAEVLRHFGPRSNVIYVELKCEDTTKYGPLVETVIETVRDADSMKNVVLKSFRHEAIREAKRIAPEIRTAALFDLSWSRPVFRAATIVGRAQASGADELSLHHALVRPSVVAMAKRAGLSTIAWTVDTRRGLERAMRLGLSALITNDPERMLAILADIRTER